MLPALIVKIMAKVTSFREQDVSYDRLIFLLDSHGHVSHAMLQRCITIYCLLEVKFVDFKASVCDGFHRHPLLYRLVVWLRFPHSFHRSLENSLIIRRNLPTTQLSLRGNLIAICSNFYRFQSFRALLYSNGLLVLFLIPMPSFMVNILGNENTYCRLGRLR